MSLPTAVLGLLLAACCLYYVAAIWQALRFSRSRPAAVAPTAPVSILKPVRGLDPAFYDCIRSFAAQDYPDFELLFAVRDPADPALPEIRRLAAEFPRRRIEIFGIDHDFGPNDKANGLERLRAAARHDLLVISDSDIRVAPDYLRRVTAPLADPKIGAVTCLYRGVPGGSLPALLEALWIATDFQVSVLVAALMKIPAALGATIALRREDLDRVGGFAPLAKYLADDYQLGKAIADSGLAVIISDCVVETTLPGETWSDSWRHRLRWGRTLRVCRPAGYAGVLITFAIPLALATIAVNQALWPLAVMAVSLRLTAGPLALRDPMVAHYFWLIPISDLLSFAVWLASLVGRQVEWRGIQYRLDPNGRLTTKPINHQGTKTPRTQ